MIHSLSGGVIKDGGVHTFVKVENMDSSEVFWLVCDDFSVEVGNVVVYEDKKGWLQRAKVVVCNKRVSGQTPPVPLNKIGVVLKVEN